MNGAQNLLWNNNISENDWVFEKTKIYISLDKLSNK